MKIARILGSTTLLLLTWLVIDAQVVFPQARSEAIGKISGLILDRGDARVPKAKVVIERKGFHREMISEDDGRYELELPIGSYTVTVTREGFHPSRNTDVRIRSTSLTTINVVMKEIVIDEDLVPLKEVKIVLETEIPKTYLQLRKPRPNR